VTQESDIKHLPQWAIHSAAYAVVGHTFGLPTAGPYRTLRVCADGVLDVPALHAAGADALEQGAIVMLAGWHALQRAGFEPVDCRDREEAGDLIFESWAAAVGGYEVIEAYSADHRRRYFAQRDAELSARAKALVDEHWPEIETLAAQFAPIPQKAA
jgi:hypothetical protein